MTTPHPAPFESPAVRRAISKIREMIPCAELGTMFEKCATNTLDTTVVFHDHDALPDTYVITGDIPAMWLRDSAAQVHPYLRFICQDDRLARMVRGLIARHCRCILL